MGQGIGGTLGGIVAGVLQERLNITLTPSEISAFIVIGGLIWGYLIPEKNGETTSNSSVPP